MDEPRKRRKKKRPPPVNLTRLLIAGGALALLLLIGAGFLSFWLYNWLLVERPTIPAPTSYASYEAPDDAFRCPYPAGWKVEAEGFKDHYQVTFTKQSASIRISQGLLGSIVGDIAGAANRDNDENHLPVMSVHELKRAIIAEEFHDYQEEPAETISTPMGKVRRSAFTAKGALGWGKIRGYRTTAMAHMTQLDVVCQCSQADWEVLQPAFAKIIENLGGRAAP
jgi:hypothetical protein